MTTPLTPTEIEEALNLAKDYDTLITDAFIQTHAALVAAQELLKDFSNTILDAPLSQGKEAEILSRLGWKRIAYLNASTIMPMVNRIEALAAANEMKDA